MSEPVVKNCVIQNKLGLHARAAAKFVRTAAVYPCDIWLIRGEDKVDGKSILDILTLACLKGTRVMISASGDRAVDAAEALEKLINDKFGEE